MGIWYDVIGYGNGYESFHSSSINKLDYFGFGGWFPGALPGSDPSPWSDGTGNGKFGELYSQLGEMLSDPTTSCDEFSEGAFRHCVNSCRLQQITGIGPLTQLSAQMHGGNLPWSERRQETDVRANQKGIEIANEHANLFKKVECERRCREWWWKEARDICCAEDVMLSEDDENCCCPEGGGEATEGGAGAGGGGGW